MGVANSTIVRDGRLVRRSDGGISLPRLELNQNDTDRLEQFLLDNDAMDDVKGFVRMMFLGSMVNPRWAMILTTRRSSMLKFRKALWARFMEHLAMIQTEVNDELMLLATEAVEEEAVPHDD